MMKRVCEIAESKINLICPPDRMGRDKTKSCGSGPGCPGLLSKEIRLTICSFSNGLYT